MNGDFPLLLSRFASGSAFVVPRNHREASTATLLGGGLLTTEDDAGFPLYGPLGTMLLNRIERKVLKWMSQAGYSEIRLPTVLADRVLADGEMVGLQFASKLMTLDSPSGRHLLTTPEMLLVRTAPITTYRDLPYQRSYTASFFRNMKATKPLLVGRELRIAGLVGFHATGREVTDELAEVFEITTLLAEWKIYGEVLDHPSGGRELVVPSSAGDVWMPGDGGARKRSLSLAVGYHYSPGAARGPRYRTKQNRNARAEILTFGLCTNRVLFAAFEGARDDLGFQLPARLRPFDLIVIPAAPGDLGAAEKIGDTAASTCAIAIDDRFALRTADRKEFAFYLGVPQVLVVARGSARLLERGGRKGRTVPLSEAHHMISVPADV